MSKFTNALLAISLGLGLLYFGAPIAIIFLFSVFLFMLLDPWVTALERHQVRRALSSAILVLISVALVILTGSAFYNSLRKVTSQIPSYSEKINSLSRGIHAQTNRLESGADLIINSLSAAPSNAEIQKVQVVASETDSSVTAFLLRGFNSAISLLSSMLFIPLIAFFLLLQKDYLHDRLAAITKNASQFERACTEMKHMSRGFFVGNFVVGSFMILTFLIVFKLMHLQNALSLAVFAGFLNLIPVFGVFFGAVVPILQAFMQFDGFSAIFIIILISVVVHFVGNNLVMPRFLGTRINVNTSAALVGFLIWGNLWGALGLFLTIPLMAMLRILLECNEKTLPYANLISETPVPTIETICR